MTITIEISNEVRELSLDFAERVIDSNVTHYAKRNQTNKKKIINDICVGKIAEFAVNRYFKLRGIDCTQPDLNVYEAKKKSFDADLIISCVKHIHVKSQLDSSAKRYGTSWMFQKTDKLITQPKATDYIALCLTKDGLSEVMIKSFLKADAVTDKYDLPKLPQLYSKRALYWESFEGTDFEYLPPCLFSC